MILTPSSRKVDSRSARTPLITTAASHGSAAPAGCAVSSRKGLVISAARRTSPCNRTSARARSGSSGLPWSRSASAPMAANRLFSALSTLAAPSSRTTGLTSDGVGRALGGRAARAGGGRGACCFCLPSRYPMSAPTAAPKPNATHRPMRENYARRGFARAAPYHGGLATPITGVLDHRGEPPYVSLPALVVELVDTLS